MAKNPDLSLTKLLRTLVVAIPAMGITVPIHMVTLKTSGPYIELNVTMQPT